MNYAKKLGQKIVKARANRTGERSGAMQGRVRGTPAPTYGALGRSFNATHVHGKPTDRLTAFQATHTAGGPAAAGSSKGFGKGYTQSYAESHVGGKPSTALLNYRRRKRGVTTTAT